MTYCLGFKTNGTAFLLADTAVTSSVPLLANYTSFGEFHLSTEGRTVQEGALKIFNLGIAGVTFAGNTDIGRSFVQMLRLLLEQGMEPRKAFDQAVSNHSPLGRADDLQALFVWADGAGAHLLSFNSVSSQTIVEHEDMVQIGSADEIHRHLSISWYKSLETFKLDANQSVAIALGICQSYGAHKYLLESGIGGAFCGLYTTLGGARWQPDINFEFYSGALADSPVAAPNSPVPLDTAPKLTSVLVCVRQDVLVLQGSTPPVRLVSNFLDLSLADIESRALMAKKEAESVALHRKADFFCFVDISRPRVVVVEVSGHPSQKHLVQHRPKVIDSSGAKAYPVGLTPWLLSKLTGGQKKSTSIEIHFVGPYPIASVHRNSPCPCGSGFRYRECHRPM